MSFYPKPAVPQLPLNTRIALSYRPQKIIRGETVTIKGTLEYRKNPWKPLPNKDVNLYCADVESREWRPIGTATTDGEGQFECAWTVNLPLGEYVLKATCLGD